jgi:CheY-like chemotaxis protein
MKQMKQILVIDDDFETCEFLTDIFSEEGWEVTARADCRRCIRRRRAIAFRSYSQRHQSRWTNQRRCTVEGVQTGFAGLEVVLISGFGVSRLPLLRFAKEPSTMSASRSMSTK